MNTLALLGTVFGLAFSAGLNLYATVLVTGLAVRLDWVSLPQNLSSLEALGHPVVLGAAALLYAVEFLADKIPAVDHLWDAAHSVIRPAGAAWIAWRAAGGSGLSEPAEIALLLAAGGIALTTHATKATTRVAVGATGGHALGLGVGLSLLEDVVAFIVSPLAILIPILILLLVVVTLAFAGWVVWRLARRRRLRRQAA
ncbi:MAG TPA: DUF4126 domain-containing protein [Vicinamibacterales bacterium]|nr:DUF4126 domain-containing protein [Acidobacteriota bacterium]HOC17732.1 DUF4126 domain-containing protein [Vicinamibacterales bacterium]